MYVNTSPCAMLDLHRKKLMNNKSPQKECCYKRSLLKKVKKTIHNQTQENLRAMADCYRKIIIIPKSLAVIFNAHIEKKNTRLPICFSRSVSSFPIYNLFLFSTYSWAHVLHIDSITEIKVVMVLLRSQFLVMNIFKN